MSRRGYPPVADRYDDREQDYYRRPRGNYDDVDIDIDIDRQRAPARPATVLSDRRAERGPRQPDFLREDYGRNPNQGPLVVRGREHDDDAYSRAPTRSGRRNSMETVRSPPPGAMEKELVYRDRQQEYRAPYPRSEMGRRHEDDRKDDFYREPPRGGRGRNGENIDIDIDINEDARSRAPPPARSEYRERDHEEIRFRRGDGERRPPPPRTEVNREDIHFEEHRRANPPPRSQYARSQGGGDRENIDVSDSS